MRSKRPYKQKLKRTLILHGIIPSVVLALLLFHLMNFFYNRHVQRGINGSCAALVDRLEKDIDVQRDMLTAPSFNIDVARMDDPNYYSAVYNYMYHVANAQETTSNVYLLDSTGVCLAAVGRRDLIGVDLSVSQWVWLDILDESEGSTSSTLVSCGITGGRVYRIGAKTQDGGYLFLELPCDALAATYLKDYNVNIVVTDPLGNCVLTNRTDWLDSVGKFRVNRTDSDDIIAQYLTGDGELLVYAISSRDLGSTLYAYGLLVLAVAFLLMFCVILIAAEGVSEKRSTSIYQLLQGMERICAGDLTTVVDISSGDEFELLGANCNKIVQKITALLERNRQEANLRVLAEIKNLEYQFNPHFLFNTLEMLKYLVRMHPDHAVDGIVALANLLRYSIDDSQKQVTLGQDIEYIRSYLTLQQYRFEDSLQFEINIQPEAWSIPIPKLIIQPIVENAAKYGIRKTGVLHIWINCTLGTNIVKICIKDDGPGFDTSKPLPTGGTKIGLENVRQRLALTYGSNAQLCINSALGTGTEVILLIPIVEGRDVPL